MEGIVRREGESGFKSLVDSIGKICCKGQKNVKNMHRYLWIVPYENIMNQPGIEFSMVSGSRNQSNAG